MENFIYYGPTKFLFGKDQFENLGEEILPFGKKILFTYGENHIKKTGVYDRVVKQLKDAGIEWIELGGVHSNPRMSLVRKGINICREENIEFILAVGGGSTSDTAKAVAMGVNADFDVWGCFEDFLKRVPDSDKRNVGEALPVGVVITKSGTGSEFDLTTVQTNPETKEKLLYMNPAIYPKFAILDPTLVYTLPADQTAYGVADMMTHYFEQYFVPSKGDEFLDRMKEANLQTIIEMGPRAVKNPEDYDARANLMYAATWSCSAQNITGVIPEWTSHFIEHEVTATTPAGTIIAS